MVLALDVFYKSDSAKSVGIIFNWEDHTPKNVIIEYLYNVDEYEPGQFYKRELPCLLKVIKKVNLKEIEVIVVDGNIYTDNNKNMGLGAHLWKALNGKIPIIGVAKNSFASNKDTVRELVRGTSKKPLYISSIGVDLEASESLIKNMSGEFRMPTLLKKLDSLTRE